jgi:hypothetical protein
LSDGLQFRGRGREKWKHLHARFRRRGGVALEKLAIALTSQVSRMSIRDGRLTDGSVCEGMHVRV